MEDPHFWSIIAGNPLNRFRWNLKHLIILAPGPLMLNLVLVHLVRACSRRGKFVNPGVYFTFFIFYFTFWHSCLPCPDRIVRHRNVANGSQDVFPRNLVPKRGFHLKSLTVLTIFAKIAKLAGKGTLNIQIGITLLLYKISKKFPESTNSDRPMLYEFSREQRELLWQPNLGKNIPKLQ